MSQEETSHLRAEIARLNRLLEALLTANEALRRENSVLKTNVAPDCTTPSDVKIHVTKNDVTPSDVKTKVGITDATSSDVKNNMGITDTTPSDVKINIGRGDTTGPDTKINMGRTDTTSTDVKTDIGRSEDFSAIPQKIEASPAIIFSIRKKLQSGGYLRSKKTGLRNHALMLIHFHNGGGGSHPELRKLTGLSEGGVSKSIASLTKRAIIRRTAFQKFALTPAGNKILADALNV